MARTVQQQASEVLATALRVLYVEDNRKDAELCLEYLRKAKFKVTADVVETPEALRAKLRSGSYDIVLADYRLPGWTGMEALEIQRQEGKDLPLILVSGSFGEEAAVECIKEGATDFVLKEHLSRLPWCVLRALETKALREEASQAEKVLRASEERYRLLFERNLAGVFRSNLEGRILDCNESCARIFGFASRQEVLGHSAWEFYFNAADREALLARLKEQRTLVGLEMRFRRGDGQSVWVLGNVSLVENENGVPELVEGTLCDITERKRAEEELQKTQERFQLVVRATNDVVWDWDLLTDHVWWNEGVKTVLGYSPEEVGSEAAWWEEHIHPDDRERAVSGIHAVIAGGGTFWSDEYRYRLANGSYRYFLDRGYVTHDDHAKPVRMIGAMMDITERKRLEDQLRQAHKMEAVGQLAGGIAHDFNNVLTIISGYDQLLLDRLGPEAPLRGHAQEIKKAADRAASLTRQLLAFGRRQMLAPELLDLNAVITNVERMLRRTIGEDIELVIIRDRELGRVKADPWQLEQVLLNLAINSRDAMPEGGRLTIETANVEIEEAYVHAHLGSTPGPHVVLSVSDSGCGMDEETKARIFEPFFTTKEKGKGTGLGLAMVYGIVKQSGGYVWVYSEPGRGTTFKIYLPRSNQPVEVVEPPITRPGPSRGSETVLLVEDEPSVRSLARGVLESNGYTVLDAGTGHEALLLCRRHKGPIHLMLTDVVMPQMGGRELASRLASLFPRMKLLYMSGYTNDAVVKRGVLEEGVAFLQKPFTPDTLAQKVREVMDGPTGGNV